MRSRCHLQLTQDPCAGCDSLVCCCLLLVQASLLCEMQQVADWQSEALLARQKARLNARAAWHYLDAAIQLMKQEMTFSRPFDGSNGAPPPTSHEAALGMLRIAVRHMPDSLQKVASALQSFAGSPDRDGALAEEVSLAASEGMPELLLPLEWAGEVELRPFQG